jgi:multidrug efflux pump subunit AcrA (membrane-fusion protein)
MKGSVAAICVLAALAACGKEPPPRSVSEFMEDPILLEATMVRCGEDRDQTRYDAECINARDAVGRIAAARELASRQDLEAQSERKRQALRRAREAAAEARRRAQEAEQRREEARYFGEFEPLPPGDEPSETGEIPERDRDDDPDDSPQPATEEPDATELPSNSNVPPEPDAASGTGADVGHTSLEEVREELTRRQDAEREQPR